MSEIPEKCVLCEKYKPKFCVTATYYSLQESFYEHDEYCEDEEYLHVCRACSMIMKRLQDISLMFHVFSVNPVE